MDWRRRSPQPAPAARWPGGLTADENRDPLDWQRGAAGPAKVTAAAEVALGPLERQQHGGAAAQPALPSGDAAGLLQKALDAEVEAAARDAMLAQCHALLSLDDPECLPHDPLFDLLPPAGAKRGPPKRPHEVAAALAAAAQEAAALGRPGTGVGQSAESTLAATLLPAMGLAPATCCRNKRSADPPAPATAAQPRRPPPPAARGAATPLIGYHCAMPAVPAAAAEEATPLQASRVQPGGGAAGLPTDSARHRPLAPAAAPPLGAPAPAATHCAVATPGSGVGSTSKVQPKAVRRVARDLSFTPAPIARPPQPGSPPRTAGSASRCSAAARLAASPPQPTSVLLQPFSLLRSPGTSAQIDALNARIQAQAAASIPFERRRPAPAGAAAAPGCSLTVRAVRLC